MDLFELARKRLKTLRPDLKASVSFPAEQRKDSFVFINDKAGAANALSQLLTCNDALGLDIETAPKQGYENDPVGGLDPYRSSIRLVQVYDGQHPVYVFDVWAIGLEILKPLMDKPLLAHNALFEFKHLTMAGLVPQRLGCTMLQANALFGGKLRSLKELAYEVLGEEVSKEQQRSDWSQFTLSEKQLAYAATDARIAFDVSLKLRHALRKTGLEKVYTLMRDALPAIGYLELNGIMLDCEKHRQLREAWDQTIIDSETGLRHFLGESINLNSHQQISSWLNVHLPSEEVKNWPRTDTGILQTDYAILATRTHLPYIGLLGEYRAKTKLKATYGDGYVDHLNPVTGRLHASFVLGGTSTGRLSCRKPNIQNPPRDDAFRSLFIAPEGYSLVVADYNQIELRVAALLSQDKAMIKAYCRNEDLHRKTAAAILNISPEAITKTDRQMAKAVNFGLLYGQGARGLVAYAKLSYGVDMSVAQADQARKAFFNIYPGLKRWQVVTSTKAKELQKVFTPLGRIRDFTQDGFRFTEALNTPIQGAAAEIMLSALIRLNALLTCGKIVNIIHDEFIVECPEASIFTVKKQLEEAMKLGFLDIFPGSESFLEGLVTAKHGKNWAEAK